jgi:poly(3-hydroxybutyrate) depolymerase
MFRLKRSAIRSSLCLLLSLSLFNAVNAQTNPGCAGTTFPTLKQKLVTPVSIPHASSIGGYLIGLPDDYNSTGNKKYPILIFIHGVGQTGNGSASSICGLMLANEWWWCPPVIYERTSQAILPKSIIDQYGQTQKMIVVSPQLSNFGDAAGVVNGFIDYLKANYRMDESRIYLTGISAGADFVNGYAGSSLANAKRIAAVIPVAPCSGISTQAAKNIADAKLAFWGLQCSADGTCGGLTAQSEANLINAQNPTVTARQTTFPVAGYPCTQNTHEIWGTAYHQDFKQVVNGRSVNLYEWMVQFSRAAALPVKLENYTVQLKDEKVYVDWTTSEEINNAKFTIERSVDGVKFTEVASIPAVGNSTGKSYQWIDGRALPNVSYYRLSQTDLDGRKEVFQVKKVLNRSLADRNIIVAPNPFTTELTAFINVPQTQQVTVSVTDMSGRVMKTVYGKYAQGAAEINFNTIDLPRGVYLLKVKGDTFTQTQKIIKQ